MVFTSNINKLKKTYRFIGLNLIVDKQSNFFQE